MYMVYNNIDQSNNPFQLKKYCSFMVQWTIQNDTTNLKVARLIYLVCPRVGSGLFEN